MIHAERRRSSALSAAQNLAIQSTDSLKFIKAASSRSLAF